MSLTVVFSYKATDRTDWLNERLRQLITKGIYWGGTLSYGIGTSMVTRAPLLAVGYDGMTIVDSASSTTNYSTDGVWLHVIRAKYNPLGSPATATISEEVMSAAQYLADPDLNYLLVVGEVTIAGGIVTAISYVGAGGTNINRHSVDPVGRNTVRGTVLNVAALPSPTPTTNRVGDCYFVQDVGEWYYWNGAWARGNAAGAGSRDGAYDDGGAGAGRTATVDSQAILDVQSAVAQRSADIANAVRRIDKTGGAILGEVGEDVMVGCDADWASYLARSAQTDGANLLAEEPCTINPGATITLTRPANMTTAVGRLALLVQLAGTTAGQDGVYGFTRINATSGTLFNLDGTSPITVADTGVANFFAPRFKIGAKPAAASGNPAIDAAMVTFGGNGALAGVGWYHMVVPANESYIRLVWDVTNNGMLLAETIDAGQRVTLTIDKVNAQVDQAGYSAISGVNVNAGAGSRGVVGGSGLAGGAFAYDNAYQVTKFIWPNWEWGSLNPVVGAATSWYWDSTIAVNSSYSGFWLTNSNNTSLVISTHDWPEGAQLNGIEVDWQQTVINKLTIYAGRHRWDTASTSHIRLPLWNAGALVYKSLGVGLARVQTYYPFETNYGPGSGFGITTAWSHGGAAVAANSDRLVLSIYAAAGGGTCTVWGVRLNVSYRSVNKFDGLDFVP